MKIRIRINGIDITRYVQKEDFPEGLEESLKGPGYHDYQVAPFSFRIYVGDGSVSVHRQDPVTFTDIVTGQIRFRGFVDSIEDELSVIPLITVFPNVMLLKDTVVGDLVDTGDDEEVREFDTGGTIHVRSIVQQLLSDINIKLGTNFKVTSITCPDPTISPTRRFFGNLLHKVSQSGFIWNLLQLVFGAIGLADGAEFRKKGNAFYLILRDAGLFSKVWIQKGAWLHFRTVHSIDWSKFKINWRSHDVPGHDISLTTIGAYYRIYRCVGGGLDYVRSLDWAPLPPFNEAAPGLSQYGQKVNSYTASNITPNRIRSLMKELGYKRDRTIVSGFDLDDNNTYVLATAKRGHTIWKHTLAMTFETPFDFYYWCTYRNATAIEILKDLAVVTDRWFYVDENDYIWLLPRSESISTVTLNRRDVLKLKRVRARESESDVSVNIYEENDGQVISYGIRLRKNEWEAIRNVYRDRFTSERVEDTIRVLNPSPSIGLMKEITMDGETHGIVINSLKSFGEPIIEVKAERYV